MKLTPATRWKLGLALALGGNVLFFTSFWIWWMPWTLAFKSSLTGILFFAPETGTLLGAAIMGKENYARLLAIARHCWARIKGFFLRRPENETASACVASGGAEVPCTLGDALFVEPLQERDENAAGRPDGLANL